MHEDSLAAAACRGAALDLSDRDDRRIDATVLRELLRGGRGDPAPQAVNLRGAVVTGELDLDGVRTEIPLRLRSCEFTEPISVNYAHLAVLDLTGSTIPALYGDNLRCEHDLVLAALRCSGGINLVDAEIGGLVLRDAQLSGFDLPAFDGKRLEVTGSADLDGIQVLGDTSSPLLDLDGASIDGELSVRRAQLTNTQGPALFATRITAGADLNLDDVRASSSSWLGLLVLSGAHVHGDLSLAGSRLSNTGGAAISAERMTAGGITMHRLEASSAGDSDTVALSGARIHGRLSAIDVKVHGTSTSAIDAHGLVIDAEASFSDSSFTAGTSNAAIILAESKLGELTFSNSSVENSAGAAISARQITVDGNFAFYDFHATGRGDDYALGMLHATIMGNLSIVDSELHGNGGPALWLQDSHIGQTVTLRGSFRTRGRTERFATIDMAGTEVGRDIFLYLDEISASPAGTPSLDLSNVTVGRLHIVLRELPEDDPVKVDKLRYRELPVGSTLDEWLELLGHRTPTYTAQPYQQLAGAYQAVGHDREARRILIAQQTDLRRRGDIGGPVRKGVHALSGALIGYGYQSWRALAGLLTTIALALALTFTASANHASQQSPGQGQAPCTFTGNVGLAIELSIPLIRTGGSRHCEFRAETTAGQWYVAAGWATQLLGWSFATLFVAGFSGLVRKRHS